jgi:hypothetical protein
VRAEDAPPGIGVTIHEKSQTIKMGLRETMNPEYRDILMPIIEYNVERMTRIRFEVCRAFNGFLLFCVNYGFDVPECNSNFLQNFFRNCIGRTQLGRRLANDFIRNSIGTNDVVHDYFTLCYEPSRPNIPWTNGNYLSSKINVAAKEFHTSVKNHYKENVIGKMQRLFECDLNSRIGGQLNNQKRFDGIKLISVIHII